MVNVHVEDGASYWQLMPVGSEKNCDFMVFDFSRFGAGG